MKIRATPHISAQSRWRAGQTGGLGPLLGTSCVGSPYVAPGARGNRVVSAGATYCLVPWGGSFPFSVCQTAYQDGTRRCASNPPKTEFFADTEDPFHVKHLEPRQNFIFAMPRPAPLTCTQTCRASTTATQRTPYTEHPTAALFYWRALLRQCCLRCTGYCIRMLPSSTALLDTNQLQLVGTNTFRQTKELMNMAPLTCMRWQARQVSGPLNVRLEPNATSLNYQAMH